MALIREAGAERDLGQPELAVCPQELLRSFNAARDQHTGTAATQWLP